MISYIEKMSKNITTTTRLVAVSAIFAAAALAIGTFGIIATTTAPSAYAQPTGVPDLKEKHINICSGFDPQCSNDDQEPTV
jgi:hypothetical protein